MSDLLKVVLVDDNQHPTMAWNKVFDAPKYLVRRYMSQVLRMLGAVRVSWGGDGCWGFRSGERLPSLSARIEYHTLRTQNDPLLQKEGS